MVWSISHFRAYLYGSNVTVYTDHSAVKVVLETPSPSAKHARWWSQVYASGVHNVKIIYRSGKENINADALPHNPLSSDSVPCHDESVQIAVVQEAPVGNMDIPLM